MRSRGNADEGEDPKADDLEIVSIGSLYRGPREKKYWSCSRGKDRYPYPVGYHAVRFHDGYKCLIEIHEASEGPLFVITPANGHSCSGKTPVIAWEKFQKKGVSRMSIWHGKRFSCRTGGVEFFGFKNPFVQRLLRELVADVNGPAEQSLLPPSDCYGASVAECSDLCANPDLLASLAKPPITRKGSGRREEILKKLEGATSSEKSILKKLEGATSLEKSETWMLKDIKVTYSRKKRQKNSNSNQSMVFPSQKEDVVVKESQENLQETANENHRFEACESLKGDGECSPRRDLIETSSCYAREAETSREQEQDRLEICKSSATAENSKLDRLYAMEMDPLTSPLPVENRNEDFKGFTDSGLALFVNDTLDELPEDEPTAAHMRQAEGCVSESPGEELDAHCSAGSSEKSEYDSIGQEIARTMMAVLLPQAIPLLKKSSNKKREKKRISTAENSSNDIKCRDCDKNDSSVNISSPGRVIRENVPAQKGFIDPAVRSYEIMGSATRLSGTNHEEKGLKLASINPETNGVREADVQDAKADELRDVDNGNSSHIPGEMFQKRKYEAPLSERIVHRNSRNDNLLEADYVEGNLISHGVFDVCSNEQTNNSRLNACEPLLDGLHNISCGINPATNGSHKLNVLPTVSNVEKPKLCANNGLDLKIAPFAAKEDQLVSRCKPDGDVKLSNELKGTLQLLGRYSHPLPILSVFLRQHGNSVYLCVQCGLTLDEEKTLFLYKVSTEEAGMGRPSFIGQTSVRPPTSKPSFSGVMPERKWFHLTPDGKSLILMGNVKTANCRERRISCSCSTCASVSFDDYTIRIVQLNVGYVRVVVNLKAVDRLLSIMVCEPRHLVATGENGRLHLWVMNPTWSEQVEEFELPTPGCISPCVVSLRKVPKHESLVIGYNGFGEFTLWDVSRRITLAKFNSPSPGTLVHDFLPICSLCLRQKGEACSKPNVDERINEIMTETTRTFQEVDGSDHLSIHLEEPGVWLLAYAVSDVEDDLRKSSEIDSVAQWRLALLANNVMILGRPLDLRAAAIATTSGHGVIGTQDGNVYVWELSSGSKLGELCHFEGSGISCIATDDSTSTILAVCNNNGKLLLFLRPDKDERCRY